MPTIAQQSLQFASSFEAEVLTHLLLRNWKHPLSEDLEFRNNLLEEATQVLEFSVEGQIFIEPIKAQDLSFIAAVWFVEWTAIQHENDEAPFHTERERWVEDVKRALPSCFCDTDDLAS
jgi:hypothetical protein